MQVTPFSPEWVTMIEQPGYFGRHREERYKEYDAQFGGRTNWRIAWRLSTGLILDFLGMCKLYEDSYYFLLRDNPEIAKELITTARDVYDDAESNVWSGLNYQLQETNRTHVQDIAIRNAILRLGLEFKGERLLRIRDKDGDHPLSLTLSPGHVLFHAPHLLIQPEIEPRWWEKGSVESFYQSNKVVQRLTTSI